MSKNKIPTRRGNPVVQLQGRLQKLAADFRIALANGDHASGRSLAEQALRVAPGNMTVLGDYALCLMRTGEYQRAYQVYMQIHDAPPQQQRQASATWLDGLTEVCGWLEKRDELRTHGRCALSQADAKYGKGRAWPLPQGKPPMFDPSAPQQNVIAYSLFGGNPRYCESAVMNAHAAQELFPGWTCRFYLDVSVPLHVQQRLRAVGAQLVRMDLEQPQAAAAMPAVLWRFLVMDDPAVKRFLLRDADSLLSEREPPAVQQWLDSGQWFHHMRDYFTHTELILAGMWGGSSGMLPKVAPLIQQYVANYNGSARFVDQYFLREALWPTVRQSLLCHDELFGFHDARPFPPHPPIRWQTDKFHVGSNTSYQLISGDSALDDGAQQSLLLWRQGQTEALSYQAEVGSGKWKLSLPFFLVAEISAGTLRVELGKQ
jgi:hypothetical protein